MGSDSLFEVSDKAFEISYNDNMNSDTAVHEPGDAYFGYGGHGSPADYFYPASSTTPSKTTLARTQAETLIDTYYVYSFDGKLLAEYDHNGNCIRDYIYMGNRLIAEYRPQTNEYFYYMIDQVNSTRIITNASGNVVFSEAYGPYGDVQETWINTYDPKLKFSGKEREYYSDLDYFGTRYYDHKSCRLIRLTQSFIKKRLLLTPSCGISMPLARLVWDLITRNMAMLLFVPLITAMHIDWE